MKTILVRGPALSRSGYGEQTRFALRALKAYEERFNILLVNTSWGHTGWIADTGEERDWYDYILAKGHQHLQQKLPIDISLQVTIPNEWEKLAEVNIGYTAGIETTKVAPHWIEKSRLMDKIIVVSNHSKNVYNDTKYEGQIEQTGETVQIKNETPIEVVNYPVRSLEKQDININLDYEFNFLAVAQMGPRKNIPNTVYWFIDEFHNEEVGLVLKTNTANCTTQDFARTERNLKAITDKYPNRKCKIYLLHGDLTLPLLGADKMISCSPPLNLESKRKPKYDPYFAKLITLWQKYIRLRSGKELFKKILVGVKLGKKLQGEVIVTCLRIMQDTKVKQINLRNI